MNLHIQSENCKDTMLKKYESETDFHFYFPFFYKIKTLKVEAEGREFPKILRSLEQFIQTVKVQNKFW